MKLCVFQSLWCFGFSLFAIHEGFAAKFDKFKVCFSQVFSLTLRKSNIAMENPPFEDVFPIQDGDFPLLCLFTGG